MAVLKLLRNSTMFATRDAALADISSRAADRSDGEIWLASYGTSPNVKTVLAIKRNGGVTIFDMDAITGDITDQIQEAIQNLHLATIATSGLASDAATTPITGSSTTVAVTGNNAADQISSLATTLKTVQDNASKYKMVALTSAEIQALSDVNVKEAYKMVSFQGEETAQTVYTQVGDVVKIYKDSALADTYLGTSSDTVDSSTGVVTKYVYQLISDPTTKITQSEYDALSVQDKELYEEIDSQCLNFVYQLADGTYQLVQVDVSKFLSESEFGDGLDVNGSGVVSVKVDTTSTDAEGFISVGDNGVKISGVSDAIAAAVAALSGAMEENERVTAEALNDLESRKANKSDLDTLTGSVLESVEAGNGITVSAKVSKKQTISLKLKNDPLNALTLDSNGLCLTEIDCGDY
jgi:hypothetical protein